MQNNGNGDPSATASSSRDNQDSEFNTYEEMDSLKAQMDNLQKDHAELKARVDLIDGESAETRLLVEKYQNRYVQVQDIS